MIVRGAEGQPRHAQGFLLDVTERREAEHALLGSEERFRSMVSNVPGVIFRCAIDADWTVEYISDAIEELTGYPSSDFIASRVRPLVSVIHPEDQALVAETVDAAVEEDRPYAVEYRVVTRDGSTKWVLERGQAVEGPDGQLVLDGAIFDASETKEAQERLREAEIRYRTLVENLPLAMYMRTLDMEDANLYVSAQVERILGYPVEAWKDDPELISKIVHPEDVEMVKAEGKRVRETGEPFRGEYRCIAADGRTVWVMDETYLVRDGRRKRRGLSSRQSWSRRTTPSSAPTSKAGSRAGTRAPSEPTAGRRRRPSASPSRFLCLPSAARSRSPSSSRCERAKASCTRRSCASERTARR
jgi:PAS domain S-box-containing protein